MAAKRWVSSSVGVVVVKAVARGADQSGLYKAVDTEVWHIELSRKATGYTNKKTRNNEQSIFVTLKFNSL